MIILITLLQEGARQPGVTTDPLTTPPTVGTPGSRPWEATHPILKALHSSPHGGPVSVMGEQGCNRTMLLQVG